MKVTWYTTAPSPHIVGLLDALSEQPRVTLDVVYFFRSFGTRQWDPAVGKSKHSFLTARPSTSYYAKCEKYIRSTFMLPVLSSDIAIVSSSYFDGATYLLTRSLRKRNIPWMFFGEVSSFFSSQIVKYVRKHLVRRLLRKADGLVGVTEETVNRYRADFGYRGPSTWAPYHRDLSSFSGTPCKTSSSRVRFLVLGDLIPLKAPEIALAALAQVVGPADLHFVGDGPLCDSLILTAEHMKLDNVHFHGRVAYEDVPRYLADSEVLVFPSRSDGFGMATMEALAAGVPVIASSRVMSAIQYIKPGVNGWLFPVDDVTALAAAMQNVIDRRDQLATWSSAARETLAEYDTQRDATRLATFLFSVVAAKKAGKTSVSNEETLSNAGT